MKKPKIVTVRLDSLPVGARFKLHRTAKDIAEGITEFEATLIEIGVGSCTIQRRWLEGQEKQSYWNGPASVGASTEVIPIP